ncbi:ImmA/IrrE family metallo-endopeptidase [Fibrobacter sp. UWEL]|uniref:helix-turn-helix domain-containing protein n=1 Tax=Fibrobacter sp. UWEL TaxID=1896209 RepID=UPI00091CAFF2|nr:XRE family transcriptional regulator [Fibrobacter sp. UWEL]SHL29655.1 Helix-turn-helix [Fibrobacter sp. UWEL]
MEQSVLSENIRRYMKLGNWTIPSLAQAAEISATTLSNCLNDKSDPRISIIQKIADKLNVSMSQLFSEKPSFENFRFRSLYALTAKERAFREDLLYSTYDKIQEYLKIERFAEKGNVFLFSNEKFDNPIEAAHVVRERLGFSQSAPILDICELVSKIGVKFFHFDFKYSKTYGASVAANDGGPAIILNSSIESVERKIFTIAHELGHILLHKDTFKSSETMEEKNSTEEGEANLFAGELLCPQEIVYEKVKETHGFSFIDAVLKIKQIYKVSYGTVLHQYCNRYGISEQYSAVTKKFQAMYANKNNVSFKNHFEPYALSETLYRFEDPFFRDIVVTLCRTEKISSAKAAELLNWKRVSLEKWCEKMDESSENSLPF